MATVRQRGMIIGGPGSGISTPERHLGAWLGFLPTRLRLWRGLGRFATCRGGTRPDTTPRRPVRPGWALLNWTAFHGCAHAPEIRDFARSQRGRAEVHQIMSRKALARFQLTSPDRIPGLPDSAGSLQCHCSVPCAALSQPIDFKSCLDG